MRLMNRLVCALSLSALVLIPVSGCSDDEEGASAATPAKHEVFFGGYIYNGASGERLTEYTLEIQYRDQVVPGTVAGDGRYLIGPIPVFQDYTVTINANGYRPFRSHNEGYTLPGPDELKAALAEAKTDTVQTHIFDAYLFPSSLGSRDMTLNIKQLTTVGDRVTAGKLRLRPTSASVLADTSAEVPSGVPGQLWNNDEDFQAKPVLKDITNGVVTVAGSEVVYGVTYLVSIYDVPGYQPFEGTITAGRDSARTFALSEESGEPLSLLSNTVASCHAPASPTVTQAAIATFTFNQDIELSSASAQGDNAEIIDSALSIFSSDTDADLQRNVLKSDISSDVQERATAIVAAGTVLTLSWNPSVGLATMDAQDVISQVSYGGLTNVYIQPVGKPGSKMSLGLLYGSSQITCM